MNAYDPRQTRRSRLLLLSIFVLFLGGLFLAGALRFSGWRPAGMKNHGELLQPPGDLRALVPRLADGSEYLWNPSARLWRIIVAPPADCRDACIAVSRQLDTVRQLFGQDADRVHILWLGEPPVGAVRNAGTRVLVPTPQLRAGLPRSGTTLDTGASGGVRAKAAPGVSVYVVDPNGFVILRYAPGFDPGDLRTDLSKLLKLM